MSGGNDKQWRDARFKKALEMAPDAAARPSDAMREAILTKARATAAEAAAATAPPAALKRRGWSLGLPWNSALATVAVVGFVSVLWWHEDLPKKAQEAVPAAAPEADSGPGGSTPARPVPETTADLQAQARDRTHAQASERAKSESRPVHEAERKAAREAAEASRMKIPPPEVEIQPPKVATVPAPAPALVSIAPAPAPVPAAPPPPPPPPPAKVVIAPPTVAAYASVPPPPSPVAAPAPAPEPRLEQITVTGRRAEALTAWTALRIRTPGGPVVLPNDALPGGAQVLLQRELRELRARTADAASSDSLPRSAGAAAKPVAGLEVDVLYEDAVVGHLTLGAGELRQQIEAALAAQDDKGKDKAR